MNWQFELIALAFISALIGVSVLILIKLIIDWIKSLIGSKIKVSKKLLKRRL